MREFFSRWQFFVFGLARRYARVVRRYGWEPDDCSQHALLLLWRLAVRPGLQGMADDELEKYLSVAVRRSLLRAARSGKSYVSLVDRDVDARRDALAEFAFEVLDAAPIDVANYLSWKLGMTKSRPEWSNNKFVLIRHQAGEFLVEQLGSDIHD